MNENVLAGILTVVFVIASLVGGLARRAWRRKALADEAAFRLANLGDEDGPKATFSINEAGYGDVNIIAGEKGGKVTLETRTPPLQRLWYLASNPAPAAAALVPRQQPRPLPAHREGPLVAAGLGRFR